MGDIVECPTPTACSVLLIRHGETVDNIKGLYAGVRDSSLTSHGVQQATRLAQYLAQHGVTLTHIYCSTLSRAAKTAQIVRDAQERPDAIELEQLECLREQDFGFYEGKPFYSRKPGPSKSGKDQDRVDDGNNQDFQDIETKESLKQRAEGFLRDHLAPTMHAASPGKPGSIAIVSHGMLLSALWKRLLCRQPYGSITVATGLSHSTDTLDLEHLGGWSNTGYLDLTYTADATSGSFSDQHQRTASSFPWQMHVNGINKKDHLTGLKRTRGGVGSAQHDEAQQPITSFFKKPRAD